MSINEIKRGQIYWIEPSPYRGGGNHVQRADRPGVIVSNDKINDKYFALEVVFLTTQPKRDLPTNCVIRSSYKTSTALCDQVQTISCEQIGSYIGECTIVEMESIDRCLMISLDLDIPADKPDYHAVVPDEEVEQLRRELEKAKYEAQMMREMYRDLLKETAVK